MKYNMFLNKVKSFIGMPYSDCVCDAIIRNALGVRFSGVNWLFRSINNSPKYRYLIERHACGDGSMPPPGAIVFKTDETKTPEGYSTGPDAYHCGVVDEDGYVIHSSPKTGVRKDMTSRQTFLKAILERKSNERNFSTKIGRNHSQGCQQAPV